MTSFFSSSNCSNFFSSGCSRFPASFTEVAGALTYSDFDIFLALLVISLVVCGLVALCCFSCLNELALGSSPGPPGVNASAPFDWLWNISLSIMKLAASEALSSVLVLCNRGGGFFLATKIAGLASCCLSSFDSFF